ncbi:MAG TPA: trigger factor family protein, partial [Candidatus Faeciplasma avium]|nr:trigger factor family protein [Candidatus Faeciplasma avium]
MLKSKNLVETNKYELEIEVSAEAFEEAIQSVYLKNKSKITVAGFRPGKAPRKIIEKEYGEGVFYEDAVNALYGPAVEEAVKEAELTLVAAPDAEVTDVSKENGVKFKVTCITKPVVDIKDYKG